MSYKCVLCKGKIELIRYLRHFTSVLKELLFLLIYYPAIHTYLLLEGDMKL